MSSGNVKVKINGKVKLVWCSDTDNCPQYTCFHPHDCPIQGARGVRCSIERWMCLTNALHGCPDNPQKSNMKKINKNPT